MSKFTVLRDHLEALIKAECQTLQQLFAKVEAKLKPVIEEDLREIISIGVAAGAAVVSGGQSFTLDAVETAAVCASRAMMSAAEVKGVSLAKETAMAVAAAAAIPTVVPAGNQ